MNPENLELFIDLGILSVILISGVYLVMNHRKMKKLEKHLSVLASLEAKRKLTQS